MLSVHVHAVLTSTQLECSWVRGYHMMNWDICIAPTCFLPGYGHHMWQPSNFCFSMSNATVSRTASRGSVLFMLQCLPYGTSTPTIHSKSGVNPSSVHSAAINPMAQGPQHVRCVPTSSQHLPSSFFHPPDSMPQDHTSLALLLQHPSHTSQTMSTMSQRSCPVTTHWMVLL